MALSDDLFQAVDTIVQARIANLPYDQTIECEIIDDSKASIGEYQVQHQAAKFTAFGSPSAYKNEDVVYVSIPKGDYKENKFIVNKKNSGNFTQVKALPFSKFIKGENLFSTNKTEFSISLNTGKKLENLFIYSNKNLGYSGAGFTRLGIKCAINSDIRNEMASGNYGIQISLIGYDQSSTYLNAESAVATESIVRVEKILTLGVNDMVGANLYNTYGYCNQEKVFDITNFYIQSATISLFQDDNFITTSGDKVVEKRIFFKNIQFFLGYDSSECVEEGQQQIILYTEDGLLYNSNFLQKSLKTRIIEVLDNNTYKIITDYSAAHYKELFHYYWEQYNVESSNQNSASNLPNYTIFSDDKVLEQNLFLPSARNRMQAGYVLVIQGIGTANIKMVSNELMFTNSAYLQDSEVVDIIMGFSATVEDEYDGKYFIYGQDSKIIDITVAALPHYVTLRYNPISEDQNNKGFQAGDIITWKIPINKTMLLPYKIIERDSETQEQNYIIYEHIITNTDLNSNQERIFKVPFLIKDYYTPANSNNTIELSMTRSDLTFTTKQELTFGTSGSQGGEYIVYIKLEKDNKQIFSIPVNLTESYSCQAIASIYDYKNSIIDTNISNIHWTLLTKINTENYGNKITIHNDNGIGILTFQAGTMAEYIDYPIILEYSANIGDNTIKGYYAVPYSNTTINQNAYIANGSTLLTYDITGKKPFFTKTEFKLSNVANSNAITWSIKSFSNTNFAWKPSLTSKHELTGPSIFDTNSQQLCFSLQANLGTNILWAAPIYMFQHRYPNATSYNEFNVYQINNNNIEENLAGRISSNGGVFLGVYNGVLGLYAFGKNNNNNLELTVKIDEQGNIVLNGLDDAGNSRVIIEDATIKSSTIDGNSSVAKLSTSAGTTTKPIYFLDGAPAQCNDALDVSITGAANKINTDAGSATVPVYFSNGIPVKCNTTLGVSITGKSASADKLNTNAGSSSVPVYFSNGVPVQCGASLGVSITGKSASADKLNTNAGSATVPVYFSNGVPVQCNTSLAISITGTANTATNYNTSTGTIKTAIEDLIRRVSALEATIH